MSRLTLAEKEHWKSRIEKRINQRIEEIESSNPEPFAAIRDTLELEAHRLIGVADDYQKISDIDAQLAKLRAEKTEVESKMLTQLSSTSAMREPSRWDMEHEYRKQRETGRRMAGAKLYSTIPEGKQILKLKEEKDSLLDTIWLATSSTQIRELWAELAAVIGSDETPLQRQVLNKIQPV